MKVLVLERINQMESVLSAYIKQQFPDATVDFVGSVDTVPAEQVVAHIMKCDVICVQSIFDNTDTFEKMIALFHKMPSVRKPVYIIHSTGKLLHALNVGISNPSNKLLIELLDAGQEVYNIYYKEFENPENNDGKLFKGDRYFNKPNLYRFETIRLWHPVDSHWIWDEREYVIPEHNILDKNIRFYKYQTHYLDKEQEAMLKPAKGLLSGLTAKELKLLKQMLSEDYARLEELIEDLEPVSAGSYGGRWQPDEKERKELTEDHNTRLALLDKMGIQSYK